MEERVPETLPKELYELGICVWFCCLRRRGCIPDYLSGHLGVSHVQQ